MVLQTGRSARIDDFSAATDPIGVAVREAGIKSAVGSPIVVEGHLWGVMSAASTEGPMPPGTEARLASFTELVATAIANAESRAALSQLADEQAALRRVATLVARGVRPPASSSQRSAKEVARVFAAVTRPRLSATVDQIRSGTGMRPRRRREAIRARARDRIALGTEGALRLDARVLRTGRICPRGRRRIWRRSAEPDGETFSAHVVFRRPGWESDQSLRGDVWGAMTLNSKETLPPDTEPRLADVHRAGGDRDRQRRGTSRASSGSPRSRRRSDGLRRSSPVMLRPRKVFEAVAAEVGKLLDTDVTVVGRYDERRICDGDRKLELVCRRSAGWDSVGDRRP